MMKKFTFTILLFGGVLSLLSCATKDEAYFHKHYAPSLMESAPPKKPFYWRDLEQMGFKPDFTFMQAAYQSEDVTLGARRVAVFHKNKSSASSTQKDATDAWYFDAETLELRNIYYFEYHGIIMYDTDLETGKTRAIRCHELDRLKS